jgi:hypothetical protein
VSSVLEEPLVSMIVGLPIGVVPAFVPPKAVEVGWRAAAATAFLWRQDDPSWSAIPATGCVPD